MTDPITRAFYNDPPPRWPLFRRVLVLLRLRQPYRPSAPARFEGLEYYLRDNTPEAEAARNNPGKDTGFRTHAQRQNGAGE